MRLWRLWPVSSFSVRHLIACELTKMIAPIHTVPIVATPIAISGLWHPGHPRKPHPPHCSSRVDTLNFLPDPSPAVSWTARHLRALFLSLPAEGGRLTRAFVCWQSHPQNSLTRGKRVCTCDEHQSSEKVSLIAAGRLRRLVSLCICARKMIWVFSRLGPFLKR